MDNDTLVALFTVGGIAGLAIYAIRYKAKRDEQILRQASGLVNGRLQQTYLFPKLIISAEGKSIELYFVSGSKNSPEKTVCRIRTSISRKHHLYLREELPNIPIATPLLKSFIRDIEMGDKEFDSAFLLQGSSDALARMLIDSEVQALLLKYRSIFPRHPALTLMNRDLTLQLNHREKDPDKLAQLVRGAAVLARKLPALETAFRNQN